MPNAVIDLRKLKDELKGRITPSNELPAVSLPNLPPPPDRPLMETEAAAHPSELPGDAAQQANILDWTAPDAEPDPGGASLQVLLGTGLVIGGVVAVFFQNFLFALLLAIAGGLVIAHAFRTPKEMRFGVGARGIRVGNRLYEFEGLDSFWIFYDPPIFKELSLRSRRTVVPNVRIPLGDTDPLRLRKILLRFLPEAEQQLSLADIISKRLGF